MGIILDTNTNTAEGAKTDMKITDPRVTGQIGLSDYVRRSRQNVKMGVYGIKYAIWDIAGEIIRRVCK